MRAVGKLFEQLAERVGGQVVLIREDVLRPEVVQRLVGPRAVREIRDERSRQPDSLIRIPKPAQSAEIEEPRFRATRRLIEIRPRAVAGRGVLLQEVIAFGYSQIDDLAIVTADLRLQGLERRARLRVAPGAEQSQRAPEIELVVSLDAPAAASLSGNS